jgi:hypothetical protein
MPRPIPKGRTTRMSLYSPGGEGPIEFPDGTWLESESFAYPRDTFTRRAYANLPDGTRRVVQCKVADTYFTIPARYRDKTGKTVRGFLSSTETGLNFIVPDKHEV